MKTVEEKARVYAKKLIVLENRYKFSDEANSRAAEYYAYKAYLAGYNQEAKDLSENKFNPDDYECLAGVCPDLSDEDHCETCTLKRLKKIMTKEEKTFRDKIEQVELEELMYDEFYELIAEAIKIGKAKGHKEATRWRDPKEECPGKSLPVVVKYEVSDGHVKYWVEEYSYERFVHDADDIGAKIIGWRPI